MKELSRDRRLETDMMDRLGIGFSGRSQLRTNMLKSLILHMSTPKSCFFNSIDGFYIYPAIVEDIQEELNQQMYYRET